MVTLPGVALAGIGIVAFGGWSLAAYFFRLVYMGRLVPRSTLEDAIHDRDETRTDNRIKDQQIAVKDEHIGELSGQNAILLNGIGPALSSFMDALQRAGREEGTKT
jgi:hypothetical protein